MSSIFGYIAYFRQHPAPKWMYFPIFEHNNIAPLVGGGGEIDIFLLWKNNVKIAKLSAFDLFTWYLSLETPISIRFKNVRMLVTLLDTRR